MNWYNFCTKTQKSLKYQVYRCNREFKVSSCCLWDRLNLAVHFFFFCFIGWPSSVKTVESSVWWSDTNCSYTDNAVTFCILKENCSHTNYMFQISSEPEHTRKTSPAHLMFDSYLEKYVSVQLGGRQILVLNLQLILWIQGYHQYQGFPAEEKRQNKSVHCSDCNLPVY